jgi:uncharacterized protein YcbK (DUF882 family)
MGDVSVHFNRSEFACSCGCGFDTVDTVLLEGLEAIRNHFERPIKVTSGARCTVHNAKVGGSRASQHKKGRAADIQVSRVSPNDVATLAEELGLSVGRYTTFTHLDSRTGPPVHFAGA